MLATILDPTIVKPRAIDIDPMDSVVNGMVIKPSRERLKSPMRWPYRTKYDYVARLRNAKPEYNKWIVSHDTHYCRTAFAHLTTQLYCSDLTLMRGFAQRFFDIHPIEVIDQVAQVINSTRETFVEDYAMDLIQWQNIKLPNRFDMKNVFTPKFVDDVVYAFPDVDKKRAKKIHTEWLTRGSVNTNT